MKSVNYIGRNTSATRSFAQTEKLYIEALTAHGATVSFDNDLDEYVMFIEIDGKCHEETYNDIDSMYNFSAIDVCKAAVSTLQRIKDQTIETLNAADYY